MGQNINIFVIYARENHNVMLHLLRHLKSLEEDFNVTIWHDDPIYMEQQWKPQIESRLNDADIFLLLVSDAFMHSEFIDQLEFKRVIDRYKESKSKVIPILIDNCPWDIEFRSDDYNFNFRELQVLPEQGKPIEDWASPDEVLDKITAAVALVIASLMDEKDQGESAKNIELTPANVDSLDQMEINLTEEREDDRITKEENRGIEEAEAQIKADEEKKNKKEEESKRNAEEASEAAATLRAEQEKIRKEEMKAKRYAEEQKRLKLTSETSEEVEETLPKKNTKIKNRLIGGSLVALLAIIIIWAFSIFNTGSGEQSPSLPKIKAIGAKDSVALTKTKIDSLNKATLSDLGIGDNYEGGIVFSFDQAGNRGKIAYPEDAGPMTWKNAMNIHEQFGEGWRLPTFNELELMYRTIGQGATNSGQFADELYWSATSYDEYQARLLRFRDGNSSYHYNKDLVHRKFRVRAVQDFNQ